jgi:hypothetical protein
MSHTKPPGLDMPDEKVSLKSTGEESIGETQHWLNDEWCFWHMGSLNTVQRATALAAASVNPISNEGQPNNSNGNFSWGENLVPFGHVKSVEELWSYYRSITPPSQMSLSSVLHFFRKGVSPTWEDAENVQGGRWILLIKQDRKNLDVYWENLVLSLAGEVLEHSELVTGIVVNKRKDKDKIAVWIKRASPEVIDQLGAALRAVVSEDAPYNCSFDMDYVPHPV